LITIAQAPKQETLNYSSTEARDFKLLKHKSKRFPMLKHNCKRLPMLKHNCKRLSYAQAYE